MYADKSTTVDQLKQLVEEFISDRQWEQFHSPKNLSMALAIEAAELMDLFKWQTSEEAWEAMGDADVRQNASDELADVLVYALAFANRHGIDISTAIETKMVKNGVKYPREKFTGRY